jgi:hypothetical protein
MKKRIALLVESPFSERDFERFGVGALQRVFDVDVLDFTHWINPTVWNSLSHTVFAIPGYHSIPTAEKCSQMLGRDRYAFAFDYLSRSAKADHVRKELKARSVARITVGIGLVPALPRKTFWQQILSLKYRTNKFLVLLSWLRRLASYRRNFSETPDIAVITGIASLDDPAIRSARKIWAHSPDYDAFLALGGARREGGPPYVVYADEDCAFHPDFIHDNIKPFVRPEIFYPALMRFFRKFEEENGIEVIIAAHPRSRWDLRAEFLDGRVPVKGKTAELISGAHLVFAHASTSIAFAILFDVPLVFLTSDEMEDSFYRDEVRMRSGMFGAPLINIDRPMDAPLHVATLARIDEEAYTDYRERYIKKSGTPNLPMWDIFVSEILDETRK